MSETTEMASSVETSGTLGIPAVVVRDLHVRYDVYSDGQRPTLRRLIARRFQPRPAQSVHAVRGVNFTVHQGEALGVIGPNGSGKSTMLRAISGLLPATSGEIYAQSTPVLLGVGAALHPELSGRRNVYLGGTALGMTRAEVDDGYDEIVAFAGLEGFMDLPLRTYSSGMAARLQFAVATAVVPDILMIDEALAVGDEDFRRRSRERMSEVLDSAGTVLLVSHGMASVKEICSRALWLEQGQIVRDGPADEVVDAYQEESQRRSQHKKRRQRRKARQREEDERRAQAAPAVDTPGDGAPATARPERQGRSQGS